jgi:protein TonB
MNELPAVTPRERLPSQRRKDRLRWPVCCALAFAVHGAAVAAVLGYWHADAEQVAGAPLILIELAAVPVAPDISPSGLPSGPLQTEATPAAPSPEVAKRDGEPAPERSETAETPPLPPAPQAEQPAAAAAPPKPLDTQPQPKRSRAQTASAPSTAEHRAARAAAAAASTSARNSDALPNWKSALLNRLERYKRYPPEAQARGEHGVAQLAFSVDRGGGVHNARIARSSGSSTLDRATLSLIERAQPLPPPPADMRGGRIAIVVPIRYNIR